MDGPAAPPLTPAAASDTEASQALRLLTWSERLKHRLLPGALDAWHRTRRTLRRGEVELRMLPFLVDPRRTAVDVGANKGTYTLHLAALARHVFAYEPNPAMRLVLRKAAPKNVTISPRAMSNVMGEAILSIPVRQSRCANNTGSLRRENLPAECTRVAVEQGRLDNEGLDDVGFLKIDVEGFELQVLEGARSLLQRDRPVLLVEIIADHTGRPVEDTIEFVERLGYRTCVVQEDRLMDWSLARERRDALARAGQPVVRLRNYLFLPVSQAANQRRVA